MDLKAKYTQAVTVIVSTYNRPKALDLVLDGLAGQTIPPAQIIIADDGSAFETQQVVSAWAKSLPVSHCWQEDDGFRKARILNRAIIKSRSPITVFLDGDCLPFPSFIEDHLAMSETGYILAGTRVMTTEDFAAEIENQPKFIYGPSAYWARMRLQAKIDQWFPLLRLRDSIWRKLQSKNWKLLRGCNFSAFTDDLRKVNGFDESLIGWGKEDSDLAVRMINAGLRIKSLKFAAPVLHLWHRQESRSRLEINRSHLELTLRQRRVCPKIGIVSNEPQKQF